MSDLVLIDDNTVTDLLMQLESKDFLGKISEFNPELQSLQSQHHDNHQLQHQVKEDRNNFEMISKDGGRAF